MANQKLIVEQVNQMLRLGNQLEQQKRFEEANNIYSQAVQALPDNFVTNISHGRNLFQWGKIDEAEKYVRKAIKLNPNMPGYWTILLGILERQHNYREMYKVARDGVVRFPDFYALIENNLIFQFENWELKENQALTEKLLKSGKFDEIQRMVVTSSNALSAFLMAAQDGKLLDKSRDVAAKINTDAASANPHSISTITQQLVIYGNYLRRLFEFRETTPDLYIAGTSEKIYVIGDSHVLSPAYAKLGRYEFIPKLTFGIKIWSLTVGKDERRRHSFRKIAATIPDGARVIFNYGEIDTRISGGIFSFYSKNPQLNREEGISKMLDEYLDMLSEMVREKKWDVMIAGIPAPCKENSEQIFAQKEILDEYIKIPAEFSKLLMEKTSARNLKYIDFYSASVGEGSWARGGCHIDGIHLNPDFYLKTIGRID